MQAYKYFFALKNWYLTFIYRVLLFKAPIALVSHNIKPGSTVTSHPSVKGKMEEGRKSFFSFRSVESLEFMVAQFFAVFVDSRPLPRIYILYENKFERIFLLKFKKLTHPQNYTSLFILIIHKQKHTIHENLSPQIQMIPFNRH